MLAAADTLTIAERKLHFHLTGVEHRAPTVILIGGGGGTISTWTAVQDSIARYAPVLTYDRAGLGRSDPTLEPQSLSEMLTDLLKLMAEARLAPPFVLVGHSVGGLHARRLALQFPNDVAGIVLVDSSHDEQVWRLGGVCPEVRDSEYGSVWRDDEAMQRLGWLTGGARSTWRLDVPMIVIEHMRTGRKNPFPNLPEETFHAFEKAWHAMQQDLASWSPRGELREAGRSGHGIPSIQPEVILDAVAGIICDDRQTNSR